MSDRDTFEKQLSKLQIDMNIGLKYCGDIDFYKEVLGISVESYIEKGVELARYYGDKDYKNYTILVHSIKSGTANIGAIRLSDKAKELELAGKEGDYDYIDINHNDFVEYYRQTMEGIAKLLGHSLTEAGEDCFVGEKEASKDEWSEFLGKLEACLRELELDEAVALAEMMLTYRVSSDEAKLITDIKNSLNHFDVEGAKRGIESLRTASDLL